MNASNHTHGYKTQSCTEQSFYIHCQQQEQKHHWHLQCRMETEKLTTFTLKKTDTLICLHYTSFVSFWLTKFSRERLEASHLHSDSELADRTKHIFCPCHLMYRASLSASYTKFFIGQKLTNDLQYCVKMLNITMKINSLTWVLGVQVSFICAGLNASIGAMWTLVRLISRVAHLVTSK